MPQSVYRTIFAGTFCSVGLENLDGFCGSAISGPLRQAGTLLSILSYLFRVEPLVAAFALVLYSPPFFIVPYFQKRLNA